MKIIGKSEQGYLISAGESEIANLFGFSSLYDKAWEEHLKVEKRDSNGHRNKDLVGMQINVSAAYAQLEWMRRRDSEFDRLCRQLRETADEIQNHKPLFDNIIGDKPAAA